MTNLSTTRAQPPAANAAGARETAQRDAARPAPQSREAFTRALREKADDRDERDQPAADAAACAPAGFAAVAPPRCQAVASAPASAPAAVEPPSGPRAAIAAALNAGSAAPVLPAGGTDPAALWQVSVHDPRGVALDVRVEREQRASAHEASANWSLTITASGADAQVLVRHAPRLDERLRKRAVALSHVRIERNEEDGSESR